MNHSIRILLVDDNPTFLGVAGEFLQLQEGLEVVGAARNIAEALMHARELKPDVILLDMNMPGDSGLDAIPRLQKLSPETKIMILTMMQAEWYRSAALSAGAHDFIAKANIGSELLPAIRRVVQNRGQSSQRDPKDISGGLGIEPA